MHCVTCGNEMRRLMRESFLQRKVYPFFGYYPWECPLCREPILYKQRSLHKVRSKPRDASPIAHPVDPNFAQPSGHASSGVPTAKAR
jgi:hypothetical protein